MSLRDEITLYTELSGNDGNHTPIGIIGAYLDGYEKGKENAQPDRMKLVQQAVNTIMSTSRSYSIRDRAFRNAARFVQCAIDGEAPDFEHIPEGDEMPPEPKWIPCDMQLPEKTQLCLVTEKTVVGFEVNTRCFNKRDDGGFWSGWGHTDVIAWMPLPEPYREENR